MFLLLKLFKKKKSNPNKNKVTTPKSRKDKEHVAKRIGEIGE